MFPALKKLLLPLAVLALILGSAAALQTPTARADLDPVRVWFLADYGETGDTSCASGEDETVTIVEDGETEQSRSETAEDGDLVEIPSGGVILCFQPEEGGGNISINSVDSGGRIRGDWVQEVCGDLDTDSDCLPSNQLDRGGGIILDAGNNVALLAATFECDSDLPITVTVSQGLTTLEFTAYCGPPSGMNLTITPQTIESHPAPFNTSHSLIRIEITNSQSGPVLPYTEVDITLDTCALSPGPDNQTDRDTAWDLFDEPPIVRYEALEEFADGYTGTSASVTLQAFDVDANEDGVPDHSEVLAIIHAEGCEPGPIGVTAVLERFSPLEDLEATGSVTVIGPVAFITVSAAPTELVCGEKSEITVTATDALNQGVSDHTLIEVLTNYGGVLAGTGTSLADLQPVNPLSSTTVELFDGSAVAYLITSPEHHGPYEVLAASTASQLGTGIQDSVPVTAQVTVNCTLFEAPQVVAPDTGTGQIRPPNTGDAGLTAGAGDASLVVVAGATLIALALVVRRRFARD